MSARAGGRTAPARPRRSAADRNPYNPSPGNRQGSEDRRPRHPTAEGHRGLARRRPPRPLAGDRRGSGDRGARRLLLGGRPRRDGDRGGPLLEFAAVFPILLLVAVIAIEAFLAFVAVERLGSAARAGARVAGAEQLEGAEAAARAALPSWLDEATVTSGVNDHEGFYVEVSHPLPIVFSASGLDLTLTRRVEMPDV